jgi:tRNA(fMet)-specific endonuclease VapC
VTKILAPFELFDYDAVMAPRHYGEIRAQLDGAGIPIGAMDLLIAAHARALGATLVTNSTAEFTRVDGLRCENWAEPPARAVPRSRFPLRVSA